MTWRYPADNRHIPYGGHFLSTFTDAGPRALPHSGVDYSRYEGSPVYVIGPGTVALRGSSSRGWGNYCYVDHGDIGDGTGRHAYSYYAHMRAAPAAIGTRYSGGEAIGQIGSTGDITGPHLHWGVALVRPSELSRVTVMNAASRAYLVDPEAFVAARLAGPGQRVVGPVEVRRRTEPSTSTPYDGNANLAPGTVVTPEGWVNGEAVDGNRVWFKIDATFSHSSGFTDAGTSGLTDLNTYPNRRTVRADIPNARIREKAATTARQLGTLDAGAVVDGVSRFARGERVEQSGVTSDVWYAINDGLSWAGSFTSQSTDDLTEIEAPTPDPGPQYPDEPYVFEADLPLITTRVVPADWSNFENRYSVPDAAQRKGFPKTPEAAVPHQWGNPGDYTLQSVLNTFQARHDAANAVAPHYTVGLNAEGAVEIIQNVSLADRAYHAGPGGNGYVGIEIDPKMTPEIVAAVQRLLRGLWDHYGYQLDLVLHRDVPGAATSCGTWIAPHLPELENLDPEPEPGPDPSPEDAPAWFTDYVRLQRDALDQWLGVN